MNAESKVTAEHLQRAAYLYVRQSTLRQVIENTESTQRQYALRRRAISLGWTEDRIIVIDHDQGQSGASSADREGFQRLVADVGLGKAGIVMGLEVSRLARNCADWHRLLEICGLTRTLILDEDGLYDPGSFNDRLLLGLKGTMSEAELHILKARLMGGRLNKARRGELRLPLPVGLVYDPLDRVELDPDQEVQASLRLFFATFQRTGSAWKTVQEFGRQGLKFPRRGAHRLGELIWQELTEATALATLHNPRYAGVFCYGRRRSWHDASGRECSRKVPQEQWRYFKAEAHPGYITWDQFLAHQQQLRDNYQAYGGGHRPAGPPREGPALLQGLTLCGKCGRPMTVRYHVRRDQVRPSYVCAKTAVEKCQAVCQRLPGQSIDAAIGQVLVEGVSPLALEVVLSVQTALQAQLAEADRVRRQHVERAQYEADQARLRFMRVDPNNRLVADTLETQWNEKLQALAAAKEEYEKQRQQDEMHLTAEQCAKVLALTADFPRLWQDERTLARDRKRMVRLLIEDVTLTRGEDVLVQIRFKGGATRELRLPMSQPAWALRKTSPDVVALIDRLLQDFDDPEVARELNARGHLSGMRRPFNAGIIKHLRQSYGFKSRQERLCEQGWLTAAEVALLIDEDPRSVHKWRARGLLEAVRCGHRNDNVYQRPSDEVIAQIQRRKRPAARKILRVAQSTR